MSNDVSISIRQRLLNLARSRQEDFDYVLRQYLIQRVLYRLSRSPYAEQFMLKGALLFWVWNQEFHRPTRDIDLLGSGSNDIHHLVQIFKEIADYRDADGLLFDVSSIKGTEITKNTHYSGVRIRGRAGLAKANIPFQVDIGSGDAVVPAPEFANVPVFLDMPVPRILVYPVYGIIAEKFQAMVTLGIANSRMKDFYDIRAISKSTCLDGNLLSNAIAATFARRKTEITGGGLYVFSPAFSNEPDKQLQWNAFARKNGLPIEIRFADAIREIEKLLMPVYRCLAEREIFDRQWQHEICQWQDKQ